MAREFSDTGMIDYVYAWKGQSKFNKTFGYSYAAVFPLVKLVSPPYEITKAHGYYCFEKNHANGTITATPIKSGFVFPLDYS